MFVKVLKMLLWQWLKTALPAGCHTSQSDVCSFPNHRSIYSTPTGRATAQAQWHFKVEGKQSHKLLLACSSFIFQYLFPGRGQAGSMLLCMFIHISFVTKWKTVGVGRRYVSEMRSIDSHRRHEALHMFQDKPSRLLALGCWWSLSTLNQTLAAVLAN